MFRMIVAAVGEVNWRGIGKEREEGSYNNCRLEIVF